MGGGPRPGWGPRFLSFAEGPGGGKDRPGPQGGGLTSGTAEHCSTKTLYGQVLLRAGHGGLSKASLPRELVSRHAPRPLGAGRLPAVLTAWRNSGLGRFW